MKIQGYSDNWQQAWDAFVLEQPEGSFFHLTGWGRVVERAFGFQPCHLLAEEDGRVAGVLPLFLVSNWIQGRTLISTPFAVYGGICASTESARSALGEAACQMAVRQDVQYLELRERRGDLGAGFRTKELYVSFDLELPSDPQRLLKQIPKDTRYMIRKGEKKGLRAVRDNAQLDVFYEIYAHSVRALGSPVFSRNFFRALAEEFGPGAEITVVWHGGKAVAGVLSFRYRDGLLPYYGGSLPEGRDLAANNFLYWEVMKSACERGFRWFDFGRSKRGTGSYFFKSQWSMREYPLPYQYYLVRRKELPNFSPANPRFGLAISLWKHMPFPLTKTLGPALVRLFP